MGKICILPQEPVSDGNRWGDEMTVTGVKTNGMVTGIDYMSVVDMYYRYLHIPLSRIYIPYLLLRQKRGGMMLRPVFLLGFIRMGRSMEAG